MRLKSTNSYDNSNFKEGMASFYYQVNFTINASLGSVLIWNFVNFVENGVIMDKNAFLFQNMH